MINFDLYCCDELIMKVWHYLSLLWWRTCIIWSVKIFSASNYTFKDYVEMFRIPNLKIEKNTLWKDGKKFHPGYTGSCDMYMYYFHLHIVCFHSTLYVFLNSVDATTHSMYVFSWKKIPMNQNLTEPKYTLAHVLKAINPRVKAIVMIRDPIHR